MGRGGEGGGGAVAPSMQFSEIVKVFVQNVHDSGNSTGGENKNTKKRKKRGNDCRSNTGRAERLLQHLTLNLSPTLNLFAGIV